MNRRSLLWSLAGLAFVSTGCKKESAQEATLKRLSVEEVAARLAQKDGKTFVFDNNPKDEYDQGHVPGAKWVNFHKVTADELPSDKSATLIFYCASEL